MKVKDTKTVSSIEVNFNVFSLRKHSYLTKFKRYQLLKIIFE